MIRSLSKGQYIRLAVAFGLTVLLVIIALHLDVSVESMRAALEHVLHFRDQSPLTCALYFFVLYVSVAALCLPVEIPMALAAGAIFGFWYGLLLASFAANIGAVLAFLACRYLLRDSVERLFSQKLAVVNAGVARDGPFYVVALRLLPVFPFFLTNITLGLTGMRARTFYITSHLSTLPAIAIYANAGTRLSEIRSFRDVLSPGLLVALILLGVLPWIAKAVLTMVRELALKGTK